MKWENEAILSNFYVSIYVFFNAHSFKLKFWNYLKKCYERDLSVLWKLCENKNYLINLKLEK